MRSAERTGRSARSDRAQSPIAQMPSRPQTAIMRSVTDAPIRRNFAGVRPPGGAGADSTMTVAETMNRRRQRDAPCLDHAARTPKRTDPAAAGDFSAARPKHSGSSGFGETIGVLEQGHLAVRRPGPEGNNVWRRKKSANSPATSTPENRRRPRRNSPAPPDRGRPRSSIRATCCGTRLRMCIGIAHQFEGSAWSAITRHHGPGWRRCRGERPDDRNGSPRAAQRIADHQATAEIDVPRRP